MTSRELVYATLEGTNTTGRAPRQLWQLPWAGQNYPEQVNRIMKDFPDDILQGPATRLAKIPKTTGDLHEIGEATDDWGCRFINLQRGIIGEVKEPIVPVEDEEWDDISAIHIPEEWLTFDVDMVNESCKNTDKFVIAGACPRPFERLQFIRGTEQLYIDLIAQPEGMMSFLDTMHDFYCRLLEKWAKTDVDALMFMDDWGAQNTLLISPALWRQIFKPMYKEYINIAHQAGKKIFMHSDGHILSIIPDLVELGLDALNSQIFCMGLENLKEFRGKITFWGEIDRQHMLPKGSLQQVRNAVQTVHDTLWDNGGCIAQCEFGPGANPENVYEVFKAWDEITG